MRPGHLLAMVDRLPTIAEVPEAPRDPDEKGCLTGATDEYVDSIKVLSRPALFPRHGPLGGHRRWKTRLLTGANRRCHAVFPLATYRPVIYDPGTPVTPGDVFLMVGGRWIYLWDIAG